MAFRPSILWVAGWLLRRRGDDLPARIADAAAIVFTVLLVILQIRHYITGGDIYQPVNATTEAALDVNAGLALTIASNTSAGGPAASCTMWVRSWSRRRRCASLSSI